nr:olfactory receptor 4C5-like [Loxodonta africana]
MRAYPAESRTKALSTCSSHITVVVLFFVPVLLILIRPAVNFPEDEVLALFYTIIVPTFDPLIFTLRNMEMKTATKMWMEDKTISSQAKNKLIAVDLEKGRRSSVAQQALTSTYFLIVLLEMSCGCLQQPKLLSDQPKDISKSFLVRDEQCLLAINLPFCGPSEIDHYFCDTYPLLKLACPDTYIFGILVVASSGMMGLVNFVVLMLSYFLILHIVRVYPAKSLNKALSTCSSHITVVVLFFAPILYIYIRPAITFPEDKVFALFYTIIGPMFNPLIYTLRNMEMKTAMRKVGARIHFWLEGK